MMQDTDLAGPLVFCLAFGGSLMLVIPHFNSHHSEHYAIVNTKIVVRTFSHTHGNHPFIGVLHLNYLNLNSVFSITKLNFFSIL